MSTVFTNHNKISPTAKLVAYWRQFAEIPFSKDIAQNFEVEKTMRTIFGQDMLEIDDKNLFISLVELRYKCIQNLILKRNFKQVLEFASGISLRGLAMTQDPELTYVETDLPELNQEKISLVQNIMYKNNITRRPNLFFHATNILNYAEIEEALKHFDPKAPLLIVHEGLMQYLSKEEKKIAAKNIHKVLSRFGGLWVTPDFDTKTTINHSLQEREGYSKMRDIINLKTGRDFEENAFDNDAEIFTFFKELGFKVDFQAQYDQDSKLSNLNTQTPSPDTINTLKNLRLWTLSVA